METLGYISEKHKSKMIIRYLKILFIFFIVTSLTGCITEEGLYQKLIESKIIVRHFDTNLSYEKNNSLVGEMKIYLVNKGIDTKEVILSLPEPAEIRHLSVEGYMPELKRKGYLILIRLQEVFAKDKEIEIGLSYQIKYDFITEGSFRYFIPSTGGQSSLTYTLEITVPAGYTAIASGELDKITTQNRHKRYFYKRSIPLILPPGIFITKEKLEHYYIRENNREFELYLTPIAKERSKELLEAIKEAYYFWERKVGFDPLPYPKITVVVSNSVLRAPHAVIGIVVFRMGQGREKHDIAGLLVHEIGHMWLGDLVNGDWKESHWLIEGLVQAFSFIFVEEKYGIKSHSDFKLISTGVTIESDKGSKAIPLIISPEGNSYTMTLNMLRHIIGKEDFYKVAQRVFKEYIGSGITNRDFQRIVEEVSQKDLSWFFDGFVRGSHKYDLTLKDVKTKHLPDSLYYTEFIIYEKYGKINNPLDIEVLIRTKDERILKRIKQVDIEGKSISIETKSPILSITIDPGYKLMDWDISNNSTAGEIVDFQWHPQGRGIFYLTYDRDLYYWDGTDTKKISNDVPLGPIMYLKNKSNFAISPKGDKIVYEICRDNKRCELWIKDIYTGKVEEIVVGDNYKNMLQWVNGREEIIFELWSKREDYSTQGNIWKWTKEKGAFPLLEGDNTKNLFLPVPSPDGKDLIYILEQDNHQTYWLSNIEGKNQRQLNNVFKAIGTPVWDPNGKRIAFAASVFTPQEVTIWVIDLTKDNLKQIVNAKGINRDPIWSRDGNHIFFTSDRNGKRDIYKVSLLDGKETRLTNTPADESFLHYNPITNQIAYIYKDEDTEDADVWIMDSDGKNQRRLLIHSNILY